MSKTKKNKNDQLQNNECFANTMDIVQIFLKIFYDSFW
jgi:hypothetical protein